MLVRRLGEVGLAIGGGAIICATLAAVAMATSWPVAALATVAMGMGFYMLHNTLQTNATQMAPERRGPRCRSSRRRCSSASRSASLSQGSSRRRSTPVSCCFAARRACWRSPSRSPGGGGTGARGHGFVLTVAPIIRVPCTLPGFVPSHALPSLLAGTALAFAYSDVVLVGGDDGAPAIPTLYELAAAKIDGAAPLPRRAFPACPA